jgi:hypothetical protein
MISPNCQHELSAEATECPDCQTPVIMTEIAEESPDEPESSITKPPESAKPPSARARRQEDVRSPDKPWKPKKEKVKKWLDKELTHYEVLEVAENVLDEELPVLIHALGETLEEWANSHDKNLQQYGSDGKNKNKLGYLRYALLEDRGGYNKQLRQERIIDVFNRFWPRVEGRNILRASTWDDIQEDAAAIGLNVDDIEQIIQMMRERNIKTGLPVVGHREARSLDELLKFCDGRGEKLAEAFSSGELEHWLRRAAERPDQVRQVDELKSQHRDNPQLGAQVWLWENGNGPKRLRLVGNKREWEIEGGEQWLTIVYSSDLADASAALTASLRLLSDGYLENWLWLIGASELSVLAKQEQANGECGLWRVIWRTEELFLPDSLEYRRTGTAYRLTEQLVNEFGQDETGGAEARFHHAVNCALRGLSMWETYFRNALKSDRERIEMLAEMPRYRKAFGDKLPEIISESFASAAPESVITQEARLEGEQPERSCNAEAAGRTEEGLASSLPPQPETADKIEPVGAPPQQPEDKPPNKRVAQPEKLIPEPLRPAITVQTEERESDKRSGIVELVPKRDELGPGRPSQSAVKSEKGKQTSETKRAETANLKPTLVAGSHRKTIGSLVPEIISVQRRGIVLALLSVCIVMLIVFLYDRRQSGNGPTPTPKPTITPTPALVLLDVELLTDLSTPGMQMVNEVAWSPTGEFLVSVSEETVVRLWPIRNSSQPRELLGQANSGRAATFSPNGQFVAIGSADGTIRLWKADSGSLLMPPLSGHKGRVFIVRFSSDGKTLVSAGGDNADKTARRWEVSTGQPLGDEVRTPNELIIAVNPDEQVLGLYNSSQGLRLKPLDKGKPEQKLEGHNHEVNGAGAFSPDGKSLAWGSTLGEVRLWRVDDGKPPRVLQGPNAKATVWSVAFSQDGLLAVGWSDGAISLWQTDNGLGLKQPLKHGKAATTVAFNTKKGWLASGSASKTIKVWQIVRGVR